MQDGLLATSVNGRPLARNHGAPWRALFPGWHGMDSVKWLEKIVVAKSPLPAVDRTYLQITRQADGNLEGQPLPRIQVKSIITAPADKAVLQRGAVEIHGLAWSGSGKISRVQVSADGGSWWQPATLDSPRNNYDWTLWQISFPLDRPGSVNLVSKAKDDSGSTQPETRDPRCAHLYGYNVWHHIRCVIL
jgi:DMSO/TMAO reductase YedYZ molybdopterin-dependent catalytic subunit